MQKYAFLCKYAFWPSLLMTSNHTNHAKRQSLTRSKPTPLSPLLSRQTNGRPFLTHTYAYVLLLPVRVSCTARKHDATALLSGHSAQTAGITMGDDSGSYCRAHSSKGLVMRAVFPVSAVRALTEKGLAISDLSFICKLIAAWHLYILV